jgi:hypothetical protein
MTAAATAVDYPTSMDHWSSIISVMAAARLVSILGQNFRSFDWIKISAAAFSYVTDHRGLI